MSLEMVKPSSVRTLHWFLLPLAVRQYSFLHCLDSSDTSTFGIDAAGRLGRSSCKLFVICMAGIPGKVLHILCRYMQKHWLNLIMIFQVTCFYYEDKAFMVRNNELSADSTTDLDPEVRIKSVSWIESLFSNLFRDCSNTNRVFNPPTYR